MRNIRHGFTMIELALVIGILSVLITMATVVSFNAISRTGLRSAENIIVQMIRRAQVQSQNNINGSQWGVFIDEGNGVITYERESFGSEQGDDVTHEFNPNITFSGTLYDKITTGSDGLTFTRFAGNPLQPTFSGTIIMTLNASTKTISVNGEGVVEH